MRNVNVCMFVGNIVRDPEMKTLSPGTLLLEFSLAVNDSRKIGEEWVEEGHFFDFALWGRRAEALSHYLAKGTKVAVTARAKHERWEDANGGKRSRVKFVVQEIEFLSAKNSGDKPRSQPNAGSAGGRSYDEFEDEFRDEIPF